MSVEIVQARYGAMRRICDVLTKHLAAELIRARLLPVASGLSLDPPGKDAYFVLQSEDELEEHSTNAAVTVYVYPFETLDPVVAQASGGPTGRFVRYDWEVAIVVRIAIEAAAELHVDTFKTLDSQGRDAKRLAIMLGAVSGVLYQRARNGTDITLFKENRTDGNVDLSTVTDQPELFGRTVWDITQRVLVPQHNG